MKYTLLEIDRQNYISVVLLNESINFQHLFPVKLEGEDVYLGDHLDKMFKAGLLDIQDGYFLPTPAGREVLVRFFARYQEYLKMFDIFSAVDLEKGEFAFEQINNPELSDEYWFEHLSNPRFSDVRIAVAEFKGLNPIEIVFMSLLTEGRFDTGLPRWQHYLTGSEPWNDLVEICNTAIDVEHLKEGGALENIITEGSKLAIDLTIEYEELVRKAKAEQAARIAEYEQGTSEAGAFEEVTETTEVIEVVEMEDYGEGHWEAYRDPRYLSPVWSAPIIIWV
jgi:hypothetical protein